MKFLPCILLAIVASAYLGLYPLINHSSLATYLAKFNQLTALCTLVRSTCWRARSAENFVSANLIKDAVGAIKDKVDDVKDKVTGNEEKSEEAEKKKEGL